MPKEHRHYNVIKGLLEVATVVGRIQDVPVMLRSGEEETPDLGLTASADMLLDRIISLQEKCLQIAVVGAVSRGKSTLINAILGEHRLPDDMEACTGVITQVIYGTNVDEVTLVEKDQRRMVPHTEFLNTVRLTSEEHRSIKTGEAFEMPERLTHIDYAVLEADYRLGESGLYLVDTPGFRAGKAAEDITKNFLAKTDALLFVTRAQPLFEEEDEEFLTAQLRRNESSLEHIFFVINDFSGLDEAERNEVKQNARLRLKDYFLTPDGDFDEALFERRVFIVDVRTALRAQLDGERGDSLESTGLPVLKREIQRMMADKERLSIKLEAAIVQALIPALNEAVRDIADKRQLLSNGCLDTAQINSEMFRLEVIQASLSELLDRISYEVYGRVLAPDEHQHMGVDAALVSHKKMAEMSRLYKVLTLVSHKKMAEMYCELGSIALANANYKQALTELYKALDLDSDREEIYLGIAEAYLGLEALEDAEKASRNALNLNPASERAQAVLDKCSRTLSYTPRTIENLENSVVTLVKNRHQKIYSVSISPDGTLISSGGITGNIWNIRTKENVTKLPKAWSEHASFVSLTFSPDGSQLASGGPGRRIKLWDTGAGKNIATFSERKSWNRLVGKDADLIRPVTFSPAGTLLASAITDANLRLWDVETRRNIATLQGHEKAIYAIAFSPDGQLLASGGSDSSIKLWDVETRRNIATLQGHKKAIYAIAFSPNGQLLVSGGSDSSIKLWDVRTWKNTTTLQGHEKTIYAVDFSPDGQLLASGGGDGALKLWDVRTWKNTATLQGHKKAIYAVDFSPDGQLLASGGGDGALKLWNLS